jgi:hypothetical protein
VELRLVGAAAQEAALELVASFTPAPDPDREPGVSQRKVVLGR